MIENPDTVSTGPFLFYAHLFKDWDPSFSSFVLVIVPELRPLAKTKKHVHLYFADRFGNEIVSQGNLYIRALDLVCCFPMRGIAL